MSRLTTGISGAIALVLISGAAQFAMGRDLPSAGSRLPAVKRFSSSFAPDVVAINRGTKADRATGPSGSPALSQTISLALNGVTDTSVLMRVAAPSAASSQAKPVTRKPMAACEPVVSVLTEVARKLQPGRCVA
jgi:hypothetical protein